MSEDAVSSSKSCEASRASHFMFAGRPKVRKTEIMQYWFIVERSLGCVQISEFSVLLWSKPFSLKLKFWTWTKPNKNYLLGFEAGRSIIP